MGDGESRGEIGEGLFEKKWLRGEGEARRWWKLGRSVPRRSGWRETREKPGVEIGGSVSGMGLVV